MAMTITEPRPAGIIPAWAVDILNGWRNPRRPRVSIDDDLEHRKAAFDRLFDASDADAEKMWQELDARLQPDERSSFIHAAILGTDEICKDEGLPLCGANMQSDSPLLRTKIQRRARRFGKLIQLWRVCTPPRCIAHDLKGNGESSVIIEKLIQAFDIGQVPLDFDRRWKDASLGIEYTASSKRGWIQHRRASDKVRAELIDTGQQFLALMAAEKPGHQLIPAVSRLLDQLAALPSMAAEHGASVMLLSQKASYLDWFRYACLNTRHTAIASETSPLSIEGWATLARIVTGELDIDRDDIAHVFRACQNL